MSVPMNPEEFLSIHSPFRGKQRAQTPTWNYVATVRKPTTVTHSCVGYFTCPRELNLIICKHSLVQINLVVDHKLVHLLDYPVGEKVVFMELYHQHDATQNFLIVATELYKICVLRWDAQSSTLITMKSARFNVRNLRSGVLNYCQGATICPRSSTILMYSKQDWLRFITNANSHEFDSFPMKRISNVVILDAKFLYNLVRPTVAVLCKRNAGDFSIKVYQTSGQQVSLCNWELPIVTEPTLLIPVHQEPFGFMIIEKNRFAHVKEQGIRNRTKRMGFFNIKAYTRFRTNNKKHSYLLGNEDGRLLMIELPELTYRILGRTSIPSSISCLSDTVVFIGSFSTDSQLVKTNPLADLQVLDYYANSGPITDFCLINKSGARRKILMCSGSHEKSVLEVFCTGTGINPKYTTAAPLISNVWSLKSSIFDDNHTYLLIQTQDHFLSMYRMDDNGLKADSMSGFSSGICTLCCHATVNRQFIQVTTESVRLICSKTGLLKHIWTPDSEILCASATANQLLLATVGEEKKSKRKYKNLIYLEIDDGALLEKKRLVLDSDVACLDITPFGDNIRNSQLAAVGTWNKKLQLFSLPNLIVLVEKPLSCLPRCVLMCTFGLERYFLCGLADGTLCTFQWNDENFQLENKKFMSVGLSSFWLRKFTSKGELCIILSVCGVPSVVFYKNEELQSITLNLQNVMDACFFHSKVLPESLVLATMDGYVFCTLGDITESGRVPILSYGQRICHHEEAQSYAIIAEEKQQKRRHHILLLDENLNTTSTFQLQEKEVGLSIVGCRFADDHSTYYCIGTSFQDNPAKGRIIALIALGGKLILITSYQANGAVHYLKNLHGGLLVNVLGSDSRTTPRFLEMRQNDDNTRELHENPDLVDLGGVEEKFSSMYTLSQQVKYDLQEIVIMSRNRLQHTAIQMIENEVLFSSDARCFLRSFNGCSGTIVGQWFSGEFITQIKPGTLSRLSDDDYAQAPSVVFSTASGGLGVIASLPFEVYSYLEKLEAYMRIAGKTATNSVEFTRECIGVSDSGARHFIDGDFLERFFTLSTEEQEGIANMMGGVNVGAVNNMLHYLAFFR